MRMWLKRYVRVPPWMIVVVCGLWGYYAIQTLRPVNLHPPPPPDPQIVFDAGGTIDEFLWYIGAAPYVLVISFALLLSSVAALVGSRIGRNALLASIGAFTCWQICFAVWWMRPSENLTLLESIPAWFARRWDGERVLVIFFVGLWVGLSAWGLLCDKANQFYEKKA
jgi:hypothetical protein